MELQKQNDGFVEVALPTLADTDSVYNLWETFCNCIYLRGSELILARSIWMGEKL